MPLFRETPSDRSGGRERRHHSREPTLDLQITRVMSMSSIDVHQRGFAKERPVGFRQGQPGGNRGKRLLRTLVVALPGGHRRQGGRAGMLAGRYEQAQRRAQASSNGGDYQSMCWSNSKGWGVGRPQAADPGRVAMWRANQRQNRTTAFKRIGKRQRRTVPGRGCVKTPRETRCRQRRPRRTRCTRLFRVGGVLIPPKTDRNRVFTQPRPGSCRFADGPIRQKTTQSRHSRCKFAARISDADICGFSRNRYLQLRMDAESTFYENVGQRAKCYPACRADYY